ncbi:alpha/beta fold hydrolase [Oceanirhabdus sp. W0125-5]|uniref:alpha/beta fold hydrolase n=1 Tax=Oceanirhabdus sp. W0125-5 TaxID=2999116 RepID=UPI0022F2CE3C|nr:alpha/beta hydrolase [Oceanirhabdus sp. W0125-5]WBW94977.1 alpha/beta hydrolase [Oceanirhabdus sp. W0125-5]
MKNNVSSIEYEIYGDKGPLIVIENGLGNSIYLWYKVVESLKNEVRILLYHRKGYGNSEDYKSERTVANISNELNELLDNIGIDEEFILLGFSFGGMIAQYYAMNNQERLNGLILLDSTSKDYEKLIEDRTPTLNSMFSVKALTDNWMSTYRLSPEEFSKSMGERENKDEHLPDDLHEKMMSFMKNQRLYKTISDEMLCYKKSSKGIEAKYKQLNIELIVLSRDPEESIKNYVNYELPEKEAIVFEEISSALQRDLLSLSCKSKQIIAKGSDHCIMDEKPTYVIDSIREMVRKSKS